MARIAAACRGITAVVGWPQAAGAVVYNTASVLRDGLVEQTYRKRELPNYAVFDERRYFDVDPDGGSCVFEVNGIPVGLLICEDLWFAEPRPTPCAPVRSWWWCRMLRRTSVASTPRRGAGRAYPRKRGCDRLSPRGRWPGCAGV
jgi:predicted amidohydrolase